jgi:orotate phosphoribosyltransferase-like protein
MATRKKITRLLVNFEHEVHRRAVALAQQGMSSAFIAEETGLTANQISYALTKAKIAEGYKAGHTYRTEWRNGTSFAARETLKSLTPILMQDAERRLPKLFEKPTARISLEGKR